MYICIMFNALDKLEKYKVYRATNVYFFIFLFLNYTKKKTLKKIIAYVYYLSN